MKILFVSDLHGDVQAVRQVLGVAEQVRPHALVVLGDVLYHGPRNPLPAAYAPQGVAVLLNDWKERIIAVRGNCDSEVDQMLLAFPMMSDFAWVLAEGRRLFLTHGHVHSPHALPPLADGDVLVCGHTHVPLCESVSLPTGGTVALWNPGSCSLPKEGYTPSYGILENGVFRVCGLDGSVLLKGA